MEPDVLRAHGAMNDSYGTILGRSICAAHLGRSGVSLVYGFVALCRPQVEVLPERSLCSSHLFAVLSEM